MQHNNNKQFVRLVFGAVRLTELAEIAAHYAEKNHFY